MKMSKHIFTKGIRHMICSFLVVIMMIANSISVFAAEEVFVTPEGTPDIKGDVYTDYLNGLLRGTQPPTGTSYVDLSYNTLTCKCTDMTVRLYSNSFFSGVTKAEVYIPSIDVDKNGMSNKSGPVTVHLRKKGASIDVTGPITIDGGSVHYINLDSSALYYLEFEKANDSQIYNFTAYVTED